MTDTIAAAELEQGERLLASFRPDASRYWRDHGTMAALGMAGAGLFLWAIGSDHVAIGSLGAVLALGVRGAYLRSETLATVWQMTDRRLILPGGRSVWLREIETARRLLGDLQIITRSGDKHLLRHLADAQATAGQILTARDRRAKRAG